MATSEKADHVRKLYEAFNRGDLEAAVRCLHPEFELYPAMEPVEPVGGSRREIRGHDGARRFFAMLAESWEKLTVEINELVEGKEERIIAFETWHVQGPQGIEVDTEIVDVYGFRDGLIWRCDGFRDKAEALKAFGQEV